MSVLSCFGECAIDSEAMTNDIGRFGKQPEFDWVEVFVKSVGASDDVGQGFKSDVDSDACNIRAASPSVSSLPVSIRAISVRNPLTCRALVQTVKCFA